jgi:hypothetical protein
MAAITATSEPLVEEDQLSPLPINTSFTQSSPPKIRTPTGRMKKPALPMSLGPIPQYRQDEMIADADQLSPLPSKQFFRPPTPPKTKLEYPSMPGALMRRNSDATNRSPASASSAVTTRSMFPQYDHSKSLSQQQYFPPPSASPASIRTPQFSKHRSPLNGSLRQQDSGVALVDLYQQVPKASPSDVLAIWHASTRSMPPTGRKVQLDLDQPRSGSMSLAIGSCGHTLYAMEAAEYITSSKSETVKQISMTKTCPEAKIPTPVAQLSLPHSLEAKSSDSLTSIFPHQAAVDAIQFVATSPAACEIAYFDPIGTSPEAARLAQDAVAEAHVRYTCEVVRSTRRRDSFGAVTASYRLQHPSLGALPITVTKTHSGNNVRDPKAKISLHHPSATEAAVAAENLVLLSLDFANNTCILDTPGLLALDEPYILDTALTAVYAAAVIENDLVVQETITFEPPPKTAVSTKRRSQSLSQPSTKAQGSKGKWYKPFGRKSKVVEIKEAEDELPLLARGALGLVGLGLRGAVWVVGSGVKAGVRILDR